MRGGNRSMAYATEVPPEVADFPRFYERLVDPNSNL